MRQIEPVVSRVIPAARHKSSDLLQQGQREQADCAFPKDERIKSINGIKLTEKIDD